jgi:hypothetical protein
MLSKKESRRANDCNGIVETRVFDISESIILKLFEEAQNKNKFFKDKIFTSKYLALPSDLRSYEISEPLNVPGIFVCIFVLNKNIYFIL